MSSVRRTQIGAQSGHSPLEPLDEYMLADDTDCYPRAFAIEFEFTGQVNRTALENALAETLVHEPRLTSLVQRTWLDRHVWAPVEQHPRIEWLTSVEMAELPVPFRIDLRRSPGLRIMATRDAGALRVVHVFHHACSDGLGALAFLGRVYATYARKTDAEAVQFRGVDATAIRNCRPKGELRVGTRSAGQLATLSRIWDVLATRPARLRGSHTSSPAERCAFPGNLARILDHRTTQQLKRGARQRQASLNDLLVAAVFRTLWAWNSSHHPTQRDVFQIMVPVDLRCPRHDELPAANLASCFFVKQSALACRDPEQLVRSVSQRTAYAVQSRSGLMTYESVSRLARVPCMLPLVVKAWRTQATALVSYVGDAARAMKALFPKQRGRCLIGELELRRVTASGPVRPGTALNLTAGTYAGELVLNLVLDPHRFNRNDSEDVMDLLAQHLLDYAVDTGTASQSSESRPRALLASPATYR